MSVGLCIRYQKHDATFAGLAVAAHLKERGTPFSIHARGRRARTVDPDYDQHIEPGHARTHTRALEHKRDNRRKVRNGYRRWLLHHQHIVWTEPPNEEEMVFSLRHNRNNILWTSWDRIRPDDEWAMHMADVVAVPTEEQRKLVKSRLKIKVVEVIPWDPLLPITRKPPSYSPFVKLLLPIYGSQLHRVGLGCVLSVSRVLSTCPNVTATIACSKGLSCLARRELTTIQRAHGTRLRVVHDCQWHDQMLLMSDHGLTVWPPIVEGLGVVGLTSLYMGTPVFSLDVAPMNELLTGGLNAILVPCKWEPDCFGVPHATPDHRRFEQVLRETCSNLRLLRELTAGTRATLEENRRAFTTGLARAIPE